MANILIVSDDKNTMNALSDHTLAHGFNPHGVTEPTMVLPWIEERSPSAVILDAGLRGGGIGFARRLSAGSDVPVFVLCSNQAEKSEWASDIPQLSGVYAAPHNLAAVLDEVKLAIS